MRSECPNAESQQNRPFNGNRYQLKCCIKQGCLLI